jgi:hypothetical protein
MLYRLNTCGPPDTSARALHPVSAAERSQRAALRIRHHAAQGAGRRRVHAAVSVVVSCMRCEQGLLLDSIAYGFMSLIWFRPESLD